MQVSGRQRQIVELLLRRKDEITAAEIAKDIKVSVRTVHRELSELEPMLAAYGAVLHKRSGKGIRLEAPPNKLEELRQLAITGGAADYSSEERKLLILMTLLEESEPLKLYAIAHNLGVAVPTVSHDLDELESWIAGRGLKLVRRRGYGVQITGPEQRVRSAICELAGNYLDDSDLFGSKPAQNQSLVTAKLLGFVGKQHLMTVEEALWQAEDKRLNELSESEYTELLIRITVAVHRMRQGKLMEAEDGCKAESLSEEERRWLSSLSDALLLELPEAEACHLAQLYERAGVSDHHLLLAKNELSSREQAGRLISHMEQQLQAPFGMDRSLREGLLSHMDSAMERLRAGAIIRNPLLAQIKKDYEQLFDSIRRAVNDSMAGIDVPDEEIGFLVMHFGASMERLKQLGRSVRAIIVCTSGIGSSKMLAVRLRKELPQIEIVGHVSWFEASRIPEESYDLIISTVDLPIEPDRYIKLSPLLTKDEAETLRSYIRDVTLQENRSRHAAKSDGTAALEQLYRLQKYLNEIVRLIDQFEIYELDPSGCSLRDILRRSCGAIADRDGMRNFEAVVQLLIERQKLSTQVIPDTRIALFHTRSEYIARPSFTLFRLSDDLPLEDDSSAGVRHLLLMLGPQDLSRESLEVLSEISSFLLNEKMALLLETGTRQAIQQFLSQELAAFFININTDMRRDLL
ncbi:hypothetical protein SD70_02895 [Gordoniibacillus kamchatkensis]|uniref:PTS system EIIA component n=1 Tax=Gordoniibacillus kamchatkensis TaxID=1590651 RepID=A0ABR5AM78_9BACL|nr:BglG family transcription antiterminator [Paenibacillus sp. VKM B-2647]KIL42135.1 hypothetical protein SD70_02895 [Paenibacillus sp. VKM B-2647]